MRVVWVVWVVPMWVVRVVWVVLVWVVPVWMVPVWVMAMVWVRVVTVTIGLKAATLVVDVREARSMFVTESLHRIRGLGPGTACPGADADAIPLAREGFLASVFPKGEPVEREATDACIK